MDNTIITLTMLQTPLLAASSSLSGQINASSGSSSRAGICRRAVAMCVLPTRTPQRRSRATCIVCHLILILVLYIQRKAIGAQKLLLQLVFNFLLCYMILYILDLAIATRNIKLAFYSFGKIARILILLYSSRHVHAASHGSV